MSNRRDRFGRTKPLMALVAVSIPFALLPLRSALSARHCPSLMFLFRQARPRYTTKCSSVFGRTALHESLFKSERRSMDMSMLQEHRRKDVWDAQGAFSKGVHPVVTDQSRRLAPTLDKFVNIVRDVLEHMQQKTVVPSQNTTSGSLMNAVVAGLPPYKLPSFMLEAWSVSPGNPEFLQYGYELLLATRSLRRAQPLQDYVSFGRMVDFHIDDKLGCDWCCLANGVADYLADLLTAHFKDSAFQPAQFDLPEMPALAPVRLIVRHFHNIPFTACAAHSANVPFEQAPQTVAVLESLHLGCTRASSRGVDAVHEEQRITELVRPILEFSWFCEAMEQRFCPLRHAIAGTAPALRLRPYYYFDSAKQNQLQRALEILKQDSVITCRHCGPRLDELMLDDSAEEKGAAQSSWNSVDDIHPELRDYYTLLLSAHG
eukprot:TRINITY_DN96953_c0_g1_i1.p1 TRINITY_DN96953_c0_g1~~TRINITY_DN96953_c0_g1_i1.p1  ORF type:complete len:431 (+),score=39.19 TRINITY_DN96953_c0_g1_i1:54-1346(+)